MLILRTGPPPMTAALEARAIAKLSYRSTDDCVYFQTQKAGSVYGYRSLENSRDATPEEIQNNASDPNIRQNRNETYRKYFLVADNYNYLLLVVKRDSELGKKKSVLGKRSSDDAREEGGDDGDDGEEGVDDGDEYDFVDEGLAELMAGLTCS